MRFRCSVCAEEHEGLPDVGFAAPWYYETVPDDERAARATLGSDFCRVDDDYFIRGSLELPILGLDGETFSYGVWMSVSRKSFDRYREIFDDEDPPAERWVGWISNRIPGYEDTLRLKAAARPQRDGQRPRLELEPTDHDLAVLQREGIPLERVIEICSAAMPH